MKQHLWKQIYLFLLQALLPSQFYTIHGNQGSVDFPLFWWFWGSDAQIKRIWQFQGPILRCGRKRIDPTKNFTSVQKRVHSDSSSNWCCSALLQTTLRLIRVTQKMWNCSHYLRNFDLWWNFSAIAGMHSRERIQFSRVSFNCLDHKSITCSHKTTFTCWSGPF